MRDISEGWWEHTRIAILRALADTPGGRAHESLIQDELNALLIAAEREHVREALKWLHDAGLVIVDIRAQAMVAMLTTKGGRVAAGDATVPGVKARTIGRALTAAAQLALDQLKKV